MTRRSTEYIHEGKYVAEVEVDLIEDELEWSPYYSLDDARKLEAVRKALRSGDLKQATELAQVYTLTPVEISSS